MGGRCRAIALVLPLWLALASCADEHAPEHEELAGAGAGATANGITGDSPAALSPLPRRVPGLDPEQVALGRALFADRRLSKDGAIACGDCHQLALGGANGQRKSSFADRPPVAVNVPTIFNLAFDFRYAWNGRFERLEDQIDFALGLPSAMNHSWPGVIAALAPDASLRAAFDRAFPRGGLSADNARAALVAYTRSLVTPDARFDRALRGELALSASEQRGYERFRDYGCVSCHQGVNVGGNMFARFGVMRDYFAGRAATLEPADMGRYNATKRERDRHVFRVPSLRNVALTAPYFHDGSASSLPQAIAIMGRYQLGRELAGDEVAEIAAFLRTLTGELEGKPL